MKTALYRHYDATGCLLYIGITAAVERRTFSHFRRAAWAGQIAEIKVEWFINRSDAAEAERAAIRLEQPAFNKTNLHARAYPRSDWDGSVIHQDLLAEISEYCRSNNLSETDFGINAINDSALVFGIKRGRELRRKTIEAVRRYMVTGEAKRRVAA